MKRAWIDPGWLAMIFASLALILVLFDRWTLRENTITHDALRTDEQGTKDALLKIADELKLKREQDAKIYGIPNPK